MAQKKTAVGHYSQIWPNQTMTCSPALASRGQRGEDL
jgi:hypothetical protein